MENPCRLFKCLGVAFALLGTVSAARADDVVETASKAGNFKTLVAAVKAAGLVNTLKGDGPFTLFAPTDEAFAKLPAGTVEMLLRPENRDKLTALLTYHVLPGEVLSVNAYRLKNGARVTTVNGAKVTVRNRGGLRIDGANVVQSDILSDNGVLYAIDSVLMPPMATPAATRSRMDSRTKAAETQPTSDIVETAAKAGNFRVLIAAAKAAGLVDTLKGAGPYTLFAPADEAFAKLPAGVLSELLLPENRDRLKAILTYHVVPGRILAADVAKLRSGTRVETANGGRVTVTSTHGLRIDRSNIVRTDILTTNGVIHVIDSVLIPPMGHGRAVLNTACRN